MFKSKAPLRVGLIVLCILILLGSVFYQRQSRAQVRDLSLIDQTEWITIADSYYGYSFRIPATWYKEMGVTPDRWVFYGDLAIGNQELRPSALLRGFVKMDFAADPVGHWLPDPQVRNPSVDERGTATSAALIPLLPSGTWTRINGMPALIVRREIADGAGPFVEGASIYILAEQMVYYLWIGYAPPANADTITRASFSTAYEQLVTHILESFAVTSEQR